MWTLFSLTEKNGIKKILQRDPILWQVLICIFLFLVVFSFASYWVSTKEFITSAPYIYSLQLLSSSPSRRKRLFLFVDHDRMQHCRYYYKTCLKIMVLWLQILLRIWKGKNIISSLTLFWNKKNFLIKNILSLSSSNTDFAGVKHLVKMI